MASRVPNIIEEVIERNADYPSSIEQALRRLQEDIAGNEPLRLFEPPAPDHDLWTARFERYHEDTWLDTEWFFSEMLAYRLILEACRYWTTRRDPFLPFKEEELASEALWDALSAILDVDGSLEERLAGHFKGALWGNRMDQSIKQSFEQGTEAQDDHLLADDTPLAVSHLLAEDPGAVHVIMDNAGTEQAFDLAMVDLLLGAEVARTVTLHVKMQPVLVSDATGEDTLRLLEAMEARGGAAAGLAQHLRSYIQAGRLRIVPDFFWNTDGRLWELPLRLRAALQNARLVIAKGDVNYRRASNDALWPADTALAEAVGDFPAALLVLRTLKSDTLVGVDPQRIAQLDAQEGADWRTSGTYGVAQFADFSSTA